MQFNQTQTFLNLARAFAGESQAGMRYQMIAQQATAQGYKTLADTIRSIAKNETHHARIFFDYLIKYAGSHDNINIDAGYPFHAGDLQENLRFAAQEKEEANGYVLDYSLTLEERFEQVKRYYEVHWTDGAIRFEKFTCDKVARRYLGELYAPLYDYFLEDA